MSIRQCLMPRNDTFSPCQEQYRYRQPESRQYPFSHSSAEEPSHLIASISGKESYRAPPRSSAWAHPVQPNPRGKWTKGQFVEIQDWIYTTAPRPVGSFGVFPPRSARATMHFNLQNVLTFLAQNQMKGLVRCDSTTARLATRCTASRSCAHDIVIQSASQSARKHCEAAGHIGTEAKRSRAPGRCCVIHVR